MGALSSRKAVAANANNLYRTGKIQQLTGTSNGQGGFVNGGTWTDVSGLSNVPFNIKTWSPYQVFMAQQLYPGVNVRLAIRYRKSVNINSSMRLLWGNHVYYFRGIDNYDQANAVILIYAEEVQATGSNRA